MRVLVTGGAGFIGSHLCERLLKEGEEVIALDDFSTGSKENLEDIICNDKFELIEGSVTNEKLVFSLVEKTERIYHLAAAVGVKYIIENPLHSIKVNVHGTENVLEAASYKGKPVVLASTSEIYGKTENKIFSENSDRIQGSTSVMRWSYACTKALDEFVSLAYYREKKTPVVIARFFNICGPRQTGRYGMVIPRFIEQALKGVPLTVYGDGRQTRSFTYITDALDGISALVDTPKAQGEVFNLGNDEAITIEELAKKIIAVTGSKSKMKFVPYKEAYGPDFEDMRYRVPDISKIGRIAGYSPKVNLDEMLDRIIKDYQASGF
jgi:UDP-glucose 4-epimerase